MRLEITIPEFSLTPARRSKYAQLVRHLEADPELIDSLQLGTGDSAQESEESEAAAFFTSQRVSQIRSAQAEARLGQNISLEQHQAEMKQLRVEWQATNSR